MNDDLELEEALNSFMALTVGELVRLCERLADKGINITITFGTNALAVLTSEAGNDATL